MFQDCRFSIFDCRLEMGTPDAEKHPGSILGDLYPFASHFLNIDGNRLHYLDEGSGPPIVMLHGNPTWSFYYRELIKGLRDRYRLVAVDHMGCGLSDKPRTYPYTLATHIDNVTRLIDHLGLNDVTLVVHDWGGPIGFGWATRHMDRVAQFVVFNTAAFLGGRMPLRIRLCRCPLVGEVALLRFNAFARAALHMATAKPERMTSEVRRGYLLPYDRPSNRVAILRFVRDIPLTPQVPSHSVVREIEAGLHRLSDRPMLICWGMKDWCFTPRFLAEWERRFPGAVVHGFPDAGHYVVEDAHERVLPLMREFLAPSDLST